MPINPSSKVQSGKKTLKIRDLLLYKEARRLELRALRLSSSRLRSPLSAKVVDRLRMCIVDINLLLSLTAPHVGMNLGAVRLYCLELARQLARVLVDFCKRDTRLFAIPQPNLIHHIGRGGRTAIGRRFQFGMCVFFQKS